MIGRVSILIVCFMALCGTNSFPQSVVNKFIEQREKQLRATEYQDARKIVEGDVDGNGSTDLTVLYTLEGFGGSNLWIQYISVFRKTKHGFAKTLTKEVGGRGFHVTLDSVASGKINLKTMEVAPSDAICCPSVPGVMTLRYYGKKLIVTRRKKLSSK